MSLGPFKIVVTSPLASPLAAKADIADLEALAEIVSGLPTDANIVAINGRIDDVSDELNDFIDAEGAANVSLASSISGEIANRIADVNAEKSRAIAVENAITTSLGAETTARIAAVSAEASARATAINGRQPLSARLTAVADIPIVPDIFLVGGDDGAYEALTPLAVRLKIGATSQDDVELVAYERANMFGDSATMDGPDAIVQTGYGAFTGSDYKAFTGSNLLARGLAKGWASAINGISAVGARFKNADFAGKMVTIKWSVQTTVPGSFGYAIVYFNNAAGTQIANFTQDQAELSVAENLSSTERVYSLTFQSASPVAYEFYVTHDTAGTGAQVTIGGLQYHASTFDALKIPVDDLPVWKPDVETPHLFGRKNLREFPRIRDQLIVDQANLTMHVVVGPGDSYSEYGIWLRNLARQWKSELGNGGPGWTGVGYPDNIGPSVVGGNVDETEMAVSFSGSGWTGQWMSAVGSPDCCSATTSTAGNKTTFTYAGGAAITSAKLFFLGGPAVSRYRWNGGAWTTLNLSGSGAQSAALSGMPVGAWTLEWEHVSGTGVYHGGNFLTGQAGIVVHDLAVAGSDLYRWSGLAESEHGGVSAAQWRTALAAGIARLGSISSFICPIGTNDQTYSRSYANFESSARLWINEVARVARPGCDVLWVAPPENGRDIGTYPQRMERFNARAKKVAQQLDIALLDMQALFGASYAEYGYTGTKRNLFGSDNLHPNDAGGAVYRQAICDALARPSIGVPINLLIKTGASPYSVKLDDNLEWYIPEGFYGGVIGSTTDCAPAILAAITAASGDGKAGVLLGERTYGIANHGASPADGTKNVGLLLADMTRVILRGRNKNSALKRISNENYHVIEIIRALDSSLENLALDGNFTALNGSGGEVAACHCFSLNSGSAGSVINFLARRLWILDSQGYGAGLQFGNYSGVKLEDWVIDGSNWDGLDIKHRAASPGPFVSEGIMINGMIARNFGRNKDDDDQVAFDLRGPVIGHGFFAEDGGASAKAGLRQRGGVTGDSSFGGQKSQVSGVHIKRNGTGYIEENYGILAQADLASVKGIAEGMYHGAAIAVVGTAAKVQGIDLDITGENCTLAAARIFPGGEGNRVKVTSKGSRFGAYIEGDKNLIDLIGINSTDNHILFVNGADNNTVVAKQYLGTTPSGGNFSDAGTGNVGM